jgi:phosphoenolpyruvate carboxykinase (ATP)
MRISMTRDLLRAALEGSLDGAAYTLHPLFGVLVPEYCPRVPPRLLDPRGTWADPAAYDERAAGLAHRFSAHFERFAGRVAPAFTAACPRTNGPRRAATGADRCSSQGRGADGRNWRGDERARAHP